MRLIVLAGLACLLCSASANFHQAEFIPTSRRAQFHGVRLESSMCSPYTAVGHVAPVENKRGCMCELLLAWNHQIQYTLKHLGAFEQQV